MIFFIKVVDLCMFFYIVGQTSKFILFRINLQLRLFWNGGSNNDDSTFIIWHVEDTLNYKLMTYKVFTCVLYYLKIIDAISHRNLIFMCTMASGTLLASHSSFSCIVYYFPKIINIWCCTVTDFILTTAGFCAGFCS